MASSTGQAAPTPSSTTVANAAAPPAATTMEPKMDAGLLALACSGSFQDLESLLNGTPAAYNMGSSVTRPPALYAVTVGGDTLLHVVASYGDSDDSMKKASLVYSKAPSLLFVQNSRGDTPLHCAARVGNITMVSSFIDLANAQGINNAKGLLETQNKLKETALHEAVRIENNDMVRLLMTHDPELAAFAEEEGTSPLYLAISLENKIIAKMLYELSGGVLSYSGPNGRNALHLAVQRSQDLTKMLLEWNNDLTLQGDANGSTPLHFAVVAIQCQIKREIKPICLQLLEANPDALYQPDHNGSFPTHVAASIGATWVINDFLMKSPNCVGLLDARGRTFLHIAVDMTRTGTVDYACRNISLPWILNMQDKDGNTALHLAVRRGSLGMFSSLFGNRQVHLNITNEKGHTPVDTAHHSLPEGIYTKGVNELQILKVLNYVGAKRGIFHLGVLKEYDSEQARKDEIHMMNQVKEGSQNRCITSVLVATITFGATFTMPGGFRADDHAHAGSPTLAGTFGFDAFIVSNTIAFALSAMAVTSLMFSGDPTLHFQLRQVLYQRSNPIIIMSVSCMMAAFSFGIYAMLAPIAPVLALALSAIIILASVPGGWRVAIRRIVLFTALCKRKGIWYGIVWAKKFIIVVFSILYLLVINCRAIWMRHTSGKVEPLAQPPTPFA